MTAEAYLGVNRSARGKIWRRRLDKAGENAALLMTQKYGLSVALAELLAGRGIKAEEAERFLEPKLRDSMPDPDCLHNMPQAAERLAQAIEAGEQIAVFADYDVDGACSAALLYRFCTALGAPCRLYIPDRETEGYGPNSPAMRKLAEEGAKLIITADCGANAAEALAAGKQAEADILVLDHHPPAEAAAGEFSDFIQVNPNQKHDISGLGYLAAAGVVYMCLVATARRLRQSGQGERLNLLSLLDLVALATICDIVPLIGLNRAFVRRGLAVAHKLGNAGLSALAQAAALKEPLNAYHCGYILGPRINAGGRIGEADLGAKLLITDSAAEAEHLAQQLSSLNYGRQTLEAEQLEEAMAQVQAKIAAAEGAGSGAGGGAPALIFAAGEWHIGIVGLLAARLREHFGKLACAAALLANGQAVGSARSVPQLDIGALIRRAAAEGLILKGGGHSQAAGFTLRQTDIPRFQTWLEHEARQAMGAAEREELLLDGSLTARGASVELAQELEQAAPFGPGNPPPLFALPNHKISHIQAMGNEGVHLRVILTDGQGGRISAVLFRAKGTDLGDFLRQNLGREAHIAGRLETNFWNGTTSAQFHIADAAVVG